MDPYLVTTMLAATTLGLPIPGEPRCSVPSPSHKLGPDCACQSSPASSR